MNNYLLALFQLTDSQLPTGAFSHSYGLETYIQEDKVVDPETFKAWLNIYLEEQLKYTDGLVSRLVYEAMEREDVEEIWKLDRMITVQNLPREVREGSYKMGERMLSLGLSLYDFPILAKYKNRIEDNQSFGHPAIVFTMIAFCLKVPKTSAISAYLYSCVSGIVQNAVRGIPLGQTAGQRILRDIQPWLLETAKATEQLSKDDFGITAPGIEISQMKHERLNIRIFMS
ncbi:urease accessory protein UreF [Lederbergia citrea]|uniref:Urease accessory protein UreF n=1 Tax=Lederbergia citrea TaxID=2833581 RepID=A0A942UQ32_9BACI|nr:urease accessory protein UreF [Lederbergia citrea]MBS4178496.1 urease accessory protein UreF [Lederbergia citrea]MBS4205167.1 urease accessory protein UreF [Lederbergia citrea]MBS4222971.1 urease accessory protein UreF [Lederbergia citrea]